MREIWKAIMLELIFRGYVRAGMADTLDSRREMWRRMRAHTGAA